MAVLSSQYQQVIFFLLEGEKVLQFRRWRFAVRTNHNQHSGAGKLEFIHAWQDFEFLISVSTARLQNTLQAINQGLVNLGLRNFISITFDLPGQILGFLDEIALIFLMQIPGLFPKPLQCFQKFIRLAVRRGQKLDNFTFR
ncbi:Uncharacterised protein [Candidatus Venteria ishoeyi]|uniref:Uncharacterized protein n=1 Tax=Candidatus Venteria ishoeyi TaxID=1899563 RepID=A0A1H6F485_9GAMM|nr:Uncharacterised protein [Candidatus Venteria ishoeyi]